MANGVDKYILVDVAPQELQAARHQPPIRMEANSAFNRLKKSIEDIGLQYPPLVIRNANGQGFTIADGHRRIAACRALNYQKIPVLISQGRPEELFSAVSGTVKQLSANQWIYVYLNGGEIPSGPTKVNIRRIDETVGREFLQRLHDAGLSPQIWSLANRVCKYTKLDDEFKARVLTWLLDNKLTHAVAAWLTGSLPAEELRAAFEGNRKPAI